MQETVDCNWSTRTLERQIGNLYYERMLMSHNTQIVRDEAAEEVFMVQILLKQQWLKYHIGM